MRQSATKTQGWVAGCVLLVGVACATPTSSSSINPMLYWPEAQYRIGYWLDRHPDCRSGMLRLEGSLPPRPVVNRVLEDSTLETCEYSPSNREIVVNPIFTEGCMAHELGHAALHQVGNWCWGEFEHDL